MKQGLILLSMVFILSTACKSSRQTTADELKKLIIEKYAKLKVTLQNGDPSYVLSMHTNDAVLFKADGTEVSGIKELSLFYKNVATSRITIESNPVSVEKLADDTAFEFGVFTSTTTKGENYSSEYINIWKRVGNDWKIYKAIDHSAKALKE